MSRLAMTLIGLALPMTLSSAEAQEHAAGSNAALKYWQAFAVMPQLDQQEAHHFGGKPGGAYPPNYLAAPMNDIGVGLIRRSDTALKLLNRGAGHSYCDWGVDLGDGPHAVLPHSSKSRHLIGLACLRARYRFEHGEHDAGVDDIVAALTLARHVCADRTLAGIYVQWANEKQAIAFAAAYLPKLQRASVERLAKRLETLPAGGSLSKTMEVEKEYLLGWFIDELKRDPSSTSIEDVFGPDAQTLAVVKDVAASPEEMAKMLESLQPHYDQLIRICDLPPEQRRDEFDSIQQQAEQASPLARLFIPGYRKTFEIEPHAQTRMALLKAAVDVVLHGPERVKTHTDSIGGPLEYRPLDTEGAFELWSTLKIKDRRFVMKCGEPMLNW